MALISAFSGSGAAPAVKTISLESGKVVLSMARAATVGIPVSSVKSLK